MVALSCIICHRVGFIAPGCVAQAKEIVYLWRHCFIRDKTTACILECRKSQAIYQLLCRLNKDQDI